MKKLLINVGAAGALLLVLGYMVSGNGGKTNNESKALSTVKIVRLDERSGGTGVIISSGDRISKVLTNKHVCGVVANGGFVIADDNAHYGVLSYQPSELHDLCLITVAANLKVSTPVSTSAPTPYSTATIAGHPSLLPTIITTGHYSQKIFGQVMMGVRKCTEEEAQNPNTGILCMFMGGLPIIHTYEMQVVSATIKPGSSGSAIYNDSGEITNLVFAGSGELGYALAVPYEFLVNFLGSEVRTIPATYPSYDSPISIDQMSSRQLCKKLTNPLVREVCKLLERSTLYVE